jgi:hypothetical protein
MKTQIRDALDWLIPILTRTSTPFQITGGLAAHIYGATRTINDIDIDVPMSFLEVLSPQLAPFMEVPPQRGRDSTWDVYLTVLNYEGQIIDLTGDQEAFVHNKDTNEWDPLEMNFDTVIWLEAFGHRLPVQNPSDLIAYKRKVRWDEEKHVSDIEAVQRYITLHSPQSRF